ncbi:MAG: heme exporter protein CcmB [Cytophagaceae bacterium]
MILRQIYLLLQKEFTLEFRLKYMIQAILIYLIGAVLVTYYAFYGKSGDLSPSTWNALFWILILFSSINAASRSFLLERNERFNYYYFTVHPAAVILSKQLYNFILLTIMTLIGLAAYVLFMGNKAEDLLMYVFILLVGTATLSAALTLIAGIAAQTKHSMTLMAILSFPIVLPVLMLLIRVSKQAIDGLDRSVMWDDIMLISAIKLILIGVSFLLFPYLWKN